MFAGDRQLERVVFAVDPVYCHRSLTGETIERIELKTERDTTGSKIPAFYAQWPTLYEEMRWQWRLRRDFEKLQVGI